MTYDFTHMWDFLLLLLLLLLRPPLKSGFRGPNPSVEAQIPVLRPKSQPQDWVLGLETGFWATRLGFGPQHWDLGLET